jgi:hypothetical protein
MIETENTVADGIAVGIVSRKCAAKLRRIFLQSLVFV